MRNRILSPHKSIFAPGKELVLPIRFSMGGHFSFIKYKNGFPTFVGQAHGAERFHDSPNMILNAGMNRHGTDSQKVSYCMVGASNTTVSAGQTTLQSQLASSTTRFGTDVFTYVPGPPPYHQLSQTFRFGPGVGTGTIAEVGVGWSSTLCYSRALIVDGGGSPTTIVKAADETLDVIYNWRVYPPTTDVSGSFAIASTGVTHDYTLRALNVGQNSWQANLARETVFNSTDSFNSLYRGPGAALAAITATSMTGGTPTVSYGNRTGAAYVANSFEASATVNYGLELSVPSGGISGAELILFSGAGSRGLQVVFNPVIPKTTSQEFKLTTKWQWARHV